MDNLYGKNICFYYYGEDHLVMNLYKYVKQQVQSNTCVYLYVDNSITNLLLRNLNEDEKDMVKSIDIPALIANNKLENVEILSLPAKMANIKLKSIKNGFLGINFIFDSSKLLKSSYSDNFSEFLKDLSYTCEEFQINMLTCYDFLEYINRGKYVNETIMKMSYDYHDYRMFGNDIIPIENFNVNSDLA
ncbi:MAG: MEDS domain-containing protein [Clostridium sp.]|uniref:hypothetical protein n=1 Tax=Clostridium sp. TaxID=1506 RepID=UPI00301EE85E